MSELPINTLIITDTTKCCDKYASELRSSLRKAGYSISDKSIEHNNENHAELFITKSGLELNIPQQKFQAISVDFCSPSFLYRLAKGGGRKQPIAKAVGLKHNNKPHVFDATAGLGRDGFILASLGCKVSMYERSAIVHALLADGLHHAGLNDQLSDTVKRISLSLGDSSEILSQINKEDRPDVIYLDPMFPARRKSSLVKKEMQVLHLLLDKEQDHSNLLVKALQSSNSRVVCKRPCQAAPLPGPKPNHAITTKKHRFDVYLLP